MTSTSSDDMTMKIKNNGSIIYQAIWQVNPDYTVSMFPVNFIIPANTSLDITFTNADSTSHNVGVSCYGKYLSMD